VLQTDEIGTFPPPLNSSITCPLLSLRPVDPREGEEEAAWRTKSRKTFKSENFPLALIHLIARFGLHDDGGRTSKKAYPPLPISTSKQGFPLPNRTYLSVANHILRNDSHLYRLFHALFPTNNITHSIPPHIPQLDIQPLIIFKPLLTFFPSPYPTPI
jgi:hypothetical protein